MADGEGVKSSSGTWMTILATYRMGLVGDTELVVGELNEGLDARDLLVVAALEDWDGPAYLTNTDGGVEVALLRPSRTRAPRPWVIHAVLLLLRFFTTFMAGALLRGIDSLATEFVDVWGAGIPVPTTVNWTQILGTNVILLHPVAFAAWLGLFVTFLNLLPSGQLDGGHILHALSKRAQRWAGPVCLLALLPLGRLWWGWWIWAGLAVLLSRGRLAHPKVLQPQVGLDPLRTAIAWSAIFIFFLTFVPLPVRF